MYGLTGQHQDFPLLGGVQLTQDITKWKAEPKIIESTRTITAVGWKYQFIKVPKDKMYWLYAIDLNMEDGNTTISHVAFYTEDKFEYLIFDRTAGKTTLYKEWYQPVIMRQSQLSEIAVYCDAHVGDSDWNCDAFVLEFDRMEPYT